MTARLRNPGSGDGAWRDTLSTFLTVSQNTGGAIAAATPKAAMPTCTYCAVIPRRACLGLTFLQGF
jgi:hypothetical protein